MAWKTTNIFINQIYVNPSKKKYATNKTHLYYIDDTWSMDFSDLKNYGPEKNEVDKYIFVAIYKLSKFGRAIPFKIENAQTKDSCEKILTSSKENQIQLKLMTGKNLWANVLLVS